MRSKWEWIEYACNELGYEEAAGIAGEIETLLKEIYGDTKTIAWMRDYIDIKYHIPIHAGDIYRIAGSLRYCIACIEDVDCGTCRFHKRGGGCGNASTLFSKFIYALKLEGVLL